MKSFLIQISILVWSLICLSSLANSKSIHSSAQQLEKMKAGLSETCLKYIDQISNDNFNFGWVTVPEDWRNIQKSKKLNIFYYTDLKANQIPAVFFNGGPLMDSHNYYQKFRSLSEPRNIGVIYFDQRGTGCSTPVEPGTDLAHLTAASRYGSFEIVRDVEVIRQKMKYKTWTLFGQSQGGTMVHQYIMDFPNSIVSAHTYAGGYVNNFTQFYLTRLKGQHDSLLTIQSQEPSTIDKIKKAKTLLKPTDCIEVYENRICGTVLLDALFLYIGNSKRFAELVNSSLNVDGSANLEKVKTNFSFIFMFFFSDQFYVIQSLVRQELASIRNEGILSQDCAMAEKLLKMNYGISADEMLINECRIIYRVFDAAKQKLFRENVFLIPVQRQINSSLVVKSLAAHPNLQYYFHTAGLDPMTGTIGTENYIGKLAQIHYTHDVELDHRGYFSSEVFWNNIASPGLAH